MTVRRRKKRKKITIGLPGPVSGMVAMELKRTKIHGGTTRLLVESIVSHIGWKYPKLLTRYKTLHDESLGLFCEEN